MSSERIVCWFSGGIASAVATKRAIEINAGKRPLVIASIYLANEHPDTKRFLKECEAWFGQEILILKNEKYNADVDEVIQKERYMSGVYGAKCTTKLKKDVRKSWQRDNDTHVMGFTLDEENRLDRIMGGEPEVDFWCPLIDLEITKLQCFEEFKKAGIEIPAMYKLGYHNNNCIGCLKGGAGYFNKIRVDFPDVFARRAHQEKMLNTAMLSLSSKKYPDVLQKMIDDGVDPKLNSRSAMRVPLRYLPANAGNHKDLDIGDCGFYCEVKD